MYTLVALRFWLYAKRDLEISSPRCMFYEAKRASVMQPTNAGQPLGRPLHITIYHEAAITVPLTRYDEDRCADPPLDCAYATAGLSVSNSAVWYLL